MTTTTSSGRKFTHNIINTQIAERESTRTLQTILTVEFLHNLSTIDDVTKYCGMPVFLKRYNIVEHCLILRILTLGTTLLGTDFVLSILCVFYFV